MIIIIIIVIIINIMTMMMIDLEELWWWLWGLLHVQSRALCCLFSSNNPALQKNQNLKYPKLQRTKTKTLLQLFSSNNMRSNNSFHHHYNCLLIRTVLTVGVLFHEFSVGFLSLSRQRTLRFHHRHLHCTMYNSQRILQHHDHWCSGVTSEHHQ